MGDLSGKVAFVTGGGAGIARTTAGMLGREGVSVVVAERDFTQAETIVEEIRSAGGKAIAVHTDVLDAQSVASSVALAKETFGRIDILFNCVGGSHPSDAKVSALSEEVWDHTIRMNLRGGFLCCREVVPLMVEQNYGSIVNVGTWGSLHGSWPKHAYVTAKGGLISFTRAIAGEYTVHGIRANLIIPGSVKTPLWHARKALDTPIIRQRTALAEKYPFSVGEPEDIGNIVLFLASDKSRMITGSVITADGGRSAF